MIFVIFACWDEKSNQFQVVFVHLVIVFGTMRTRFRLLIYGSFTYVRFGNSELFCNGY